MLLSTSNSQKQSIVKPLRSTAPLFLLLLIILSTSTHAKWQIENFYPKFQEKLKSTPSGEDLLKNVDQFMSNSVKNVPLLEKIMQSGGIRGFYNYVQIFGVFEFLLESFPSVVKGFESIGFTYQRNPMMALRIGKRNEAKQEVYSNSIHTLNESPFTEKEERLVKPLILITGAHHSRELLTQNMVLKICLEHMHELLYSQNDDLTHREMTDLLLIPFVNLDGHKYIADSFEFSENNNTEVKQEYLKHYGIELSSFLHASEKRKNMNKTYCQEGRDGLNSGVDLNRNYGYHWGHYESDDEDKCSEVYKGPYPFSESETDNIRKLVEREKNFIVLIINFHSYGNLWIQPYNYSTSQDLKKFQMETHLFQFYEKMSKEIVDICPEAEVGNAMKTVDYLSLGEASDWALGEHKIIAYSPELGYKDRRTDNFIFPRELINNALNENMKIIDHMLSKSKYSVDKFSYYVNNKHEMVIELDNDSLGKVFNGKLRVKASDLRFFDALTGIRLKQERFAPENLKFSRVASYDPSLEDSGRWSFPMHSNHLVNRVNEENYIEVDVPELNYLTKAFLVFEMDATMNVMQKVDFEVSLVFNDMFTVQEFEFQVQFNYSMFWKYAFMIIVYFNCVVVALLVIFKLVCPMQFFGEKMKAIDKVRSGNRSQVGKMENANGSAQARKFK